MFGAVSVSLCASGPHRVDAVGLNVRVFGYDVFGQWAEWFV